MKILIVSQYYFPYTSGLSVYAKILAESLAKKNDVSVLSLSHDVSLKNTETISGVHVKRITPAIKYQRGAFSFLFSLAFFQQARKADIVNLHLPFFEAGLLAFLCKVLLRKPLVITYHCDMNMRSGFFSKLIEKIYYASAFLSLKLSDIIISNSKDYIEHSKVKVFSDKTKSIHPPSSINIVDQNIKTNLKQRFGLSDKTKVAGFLGRITREKGLDSFIRSLPMVRTKYSDIVYIVAGENLKMAGGKKESVYRSLKNIVEDFGAQDKVIFTGYIPKEDLSGFYRTCDLLVVPSNNSLESFGIVQLEAMAHNVPVVSSDLPGVRDLVVKTKFGTLIKPDNPKSIATGIIKVLDEKNSYKFDVEQFRKDLSPLVTVNYYETIFRELIGQGNFSS
ncbi:MAG: glycosyltransferase family 4 protein [Candidatus Omnitrophica bacterium]|nr:glycosyltransferase family 4 protein [Candidatus Omnitrophota bacterium]